MSRRPDRRALLLASLLLVPALPAPAREATRRETAGGGRRRLDLRIRRDELGIAPAPIDRPETGPATVPAETPVRGGLAVELRPARRDRDPGPATRAPAAERDALSDGLDRLGLEALLIRLIRPL
jgi:hypothetical protein